MSLGTLGIQCEGVAHSYPALGKIGDLAYPGLVLFVVFVALICGGGTRQGLWSDALAQIVSLPLLAVAALQA